MPAAIYVFSLCAFAFGLSEFVVAGLLTAIADDLDAPISLVGTAIAAYALGAAIGAPFITALVAHWRDRHILLLATALLGVGSLLMSASPNLMVLLAVRFVFGLGHGVFMAVASDAATRLVDPQRSGRALSVVWIGLTLALAIGVPLGTYLGSLWSWRVVFMAIGVLSVGGMLGLVLCMPRGVAEVGEVAHLAQVLDACNGLDVAVLAPDAIPAPGWANALAACFSRDASIATATPWCNAGESAAWPRIGEINQVPDDLSRLARACQMLRQPAPALSEVALSCGFASASHFSNRFRQALGATPGQYRAAFQ